MSFFSDKFGQQYATKIGYIVEPSCNDQYLHRFGGGSWNIEVENAAIDVPVLLFVLDLNDPKLANFSSNHLINEIPICSYINSNLVEGEQIYQINHDTKSIVLQHQEITNIQPFDSEDKLPNPLPEKRICLREMNSLEYPLNESSYWKNTDDFLGGKGCFRVGGYPLWLQETKKVICNCGQEMTHIMSIGYENWNASSQYLNDEVFFIGEIALYAFVCKKCSGLKIISQST